MKKAVPLVLALASCPAFAAEDREPSLSDWGSIGLLQTPTARMEPDGTVSGGLTALGGVHRHVTFGAQPLPGLEVTARETAYPGYFGLSEPGLDLKLRIRQEDERGPAVAIGGRDVTGSGLDLPGKGRFAGEYIVATRRWWDLDLSLGLGWGTYGETGHFRNPLRFLGGRFRRDRDPSAWPSIRGPRAWFGGERVALFGGVEWYTPIPDLSLKLEYSADRFRAQTQEDWLFRTGNHYNIGLSYRPAPWIDIGAGFEQGSRAMLRLSARFDPGSPASPAGPPPAVGPRPSAGSALSADAIVTVARTHGLPARTALVAGDRAVLWLDPAGGGPAPLAREVGRAARLLADLAPAEVEELTIVIGVAGLTETSVTLARRDIERAANRRGSTDEIWRTAEVAPEAGPPPDWPLNLDLGIRPTVEVGLADLGYPLVARAYTDTRLRMEPWRGVVLAAGLRTNLGNNLDLLDTNALPAAEPVRSDLPLYAQALLQVEHLYGAWLARPAPGWTTRLSVGHFEEMFGGIGAEVLYRPPQARWAVALDVNELWKRPPGAPFRLAAGSARLTGHASFYLEHPGGTGTTSVLRLGRYLGGDWGGTAEVLRRFDGGATLAAQATWTEGPDKGQTRFGGRLDYGITLAVPLAQSSWLPVGGFSDTTVRTLGRDAGQRLRQPLPLYDLQVPTSYGSLAGTWSRLLD